MKEIQYVTQFDNAVVFVRYVGHSVQCSLTPAVTWNWWPAVSCGESSPTVDRHALHRTMCCVHLKFRLVFTLSLSAF